MYGYIYKTTNLMNGRIYIGKRKGKFDIKYFGSGRYILNALNKYGKENFKVEVIEWCEDLNDQNQKEIYWISYYRGLEVPMYNISNGGDGGDVYSKLSDSDKVKWRANNNFCQGITANRTKEEKHKIALKIWKTRRENGTDRLTDGQKEYQREVHLGQKVSDETRKKISNTLKKNPPMLGKHHTKETKIKIGLKIRNMMVSDEIKAKMSKVQKERAMQKDYINPFKGKHHTEETRMKIAEYNRLGICGNKGKHFTDEHKMKISRANKGKHHTEETKKKLSEINKGQKAHNKNKVCYNNGIRNIYLNPDIDVIPDGFIMGGKSYSKKK